MKTRDLIERLQAADPSGDLEVVVGCEDIYFVAREPMHYDGTPILLVRDPSKRPYYDIIGAHMPNGGTKIRVHTVSLETILRDNPDAPITYADERTRSVCEPHLESIRRGIRDDA